MKQISILIIPLFILLSCTENTNKANKFKRPNLPYNAQVSVENIDSTKSQLYIEYYDKEGLLSIVDQFYPYTEDGKPVDLNNLKVYNPESRFVYTYNTQKQLSSFAEIWHNSFRKKENGTRTDTSNFGRFIYNSAGKLSRLEINTDYNNPDQVRGVDVFYNELGLKTKTIQIFDVTKRARHNEAGLDSTYFSYDDKQRLIKMYKYGHAPNRELDEEHIYTYNDTNNSKSCIRYGWQETGKKERDYEDIEFFDVQGRITKNISIFAYQPGTVMYEYNKLGNFKKISAHNSLYKPSRLDETVAYIYSDTTRQFYRPKPQCDYMERFNLSLYGED
jgi:hypothetical protein